MAEIKRPNYFTSQFLVEKDFNDEQAYHLNLRRRLNRVQHSSGVADGLAVTRIGPTQVQVSVGTAIDKDGREIVLQEPRTYTLATAGSNLDVYLTIAYQEVFDPADHYNQAGLDKYTRTTERPLLQDGTAVPPSDGSVVPLARIRLSTSGAIESDGSIDTTIRALTGARLAPQSVGTTQLADGAVTLAKLADDAQPLAIQGTNAITVAVDNALKKVTVGESHSALTNNPHATTAQHIDTQGGTNRIVTQINAGTGVISAARLERVMVTGVAVFSNLQPNQDQFTDEIDPGLGEGPLRVEFSFDDVPQTGITMMSDPAYGRGILARIEVNRSTGRFRIFAMRTGGSGGARIRWYAFKMPALPDTTVQVGVAVTPSQIAMAGNSTQVLTASLNNALGSVTWSGPEAGGGSLAVNGALTATYTSPGLSGTYHVTATSNADPTKSATATIIVTAAIAVNLSHTSVNMVPNQQLTISGDVINTPNKGINWSILNNAGGTVSPASGSSTTFTAPATSGTYTVVATSVADPTKKANCVITVLAVSISVTADQTELDAGTSTTIRAHISPAFADNRANWTVLGGGTLSASQGATTVYTAPIRNFGSNPVVTGTSVSDNTKSASVTLTANGGGGPGPGPGGPGPGPGKFETDNIMAQAGVPPGESDASVTASTSAGTPSDAKARTFIRPQLRPSAKRPSEPDA